MAKFKKRFIAGAVCPRCQAMDKIMTYREAEKEFRECVTCGFKEEKHFSPQFAPLATRVNGGEDDITPVKILNAPDVDE